MKPLFSFLLTLCLFGCKEKVPTLSGPSYGLVGTYEGVSTMPSNFPYIFKDLFPQADSFQDTITATITQASPTTYTMQFQLSGIAKKGNTSSPYGFSVEANFTMPTYGVGATASLKTKYNSLYPASPDFGTSKEVGGLLEVEGNTLIVGFLTPYKEDAYPLALAKLSKIK